MKASHPFFTRLENRGSPETDAGSRNTGHGREQSVSVSDMSSEKEVGEDDGSFDEDNGNETFDESERSSRESDCESR